MYTIRSQIQSQFQMIRKIIIVVLVNLALQQPLLAISTDNVCTFHVSDKLFSLLYLQKQHPRELPLNQNETIYINFCSSFVPKECPSATSAYSFVVRTSQPETEDEDDKEEDEDNMTASYQCTRYSSNSYSSLFTASYYKQGGRLGTLVMKYATEKDKQVTTEGFRRSTEIYISCSDEESFEIEHYQVHNGVISIRGTSRYGCPVFEISSIWKVFEDNRIIFGIIMVILGIYLLFYGRVTLEVTIFIAAFVISFAILGSIFTLFVSPYSSTFVIYFSFLILLLLSTLFGYGVTKLVNVSVFFVGALFGFIIGALVNSIFCKIFNIYSVWSLVVFEIAFTIPFGLLTFKYKDEVIIASSSLTGAYLIVRPISWIFGGFPNEFLLYQMFESGEITSLPWTFFIYLIIIIALAIVGAMYQILKLHRQNPQDQIEVNFIQQTLEKPMDKVKEKVDQLIERFKPDDGLAAGSRDDYRKMSELKEKESFYSDVNKTDVNKKSGEKL